MKQKKKYTSNSKLGLLFLLENSILPQINKFEFTSTSDCEPTEKRFPKLNNNKKNHYITKEYILNSQKSK